MSVKLSTLSVGYCGKIQGERFIVTERWPEGRASGSTHIQWETRGTEIFVWDIRDPDVIPIGIGKRVVTIEWPNSNWNWFRREPSTTTAEKRVVTIEWPK
jgi:hypothetical protein